MLIVLLLDLASALHALGLRWASRRLVDLAQEMTITGSDVDRR